MNKGISFATIGDAPLLRDLNATDRVVATLSA